MKSQANIKSNFKQNAFDILKSALIATIISLVFVIILALVAKATSMSDKTIEIVNYVIKIISIFIGCIIGIKYPENGILKGTISALLYIGVTIFIFAAFLAFKGVNVNWLDFVFLPIAGAISGVIKVNIKK
ncbi:MAG: TIGR04086 family membrane protein [Clostridia bacterium]|nr:TIGR04086 family membrane protein [Clostridia bacterium]